MVKVESDTRAHKVKFVVRLFLASVITLLGLGLATWQFFQAHWFGGVGALCGAALLLGLIIFGKDFLADSAWGQVLAAFTAVLGFYGFLFENRALDVRLDQARLEAAMAMSTPSASCAQGAAQAGFQQGARMCFLQSNVDKLGAVGDAAKEAYLPPQLELAENVLGTATGKAPDACRNAFLKLHKSCPAAFAAMSVNAIAKLQESQ